MNGPRNPWTAIATVALVAIATVPAQVAVRAGTLHTMSGPPLQDAIVVVQDGKITAVGPAASTPVPDGVRLLQAAVVTPGLIDGRTVVGLAGYLNQNHDQDQLERSAPMQPELRAIDAYNARERLIEWVRRFGVTTIHTGHGPGPLISGQTAILKTRGNSVDQAVVRPIAMVAATLASPSRDASKNAPGTRAKAAAMLREMLVDTQEYRSKQANDDPTKRPDPDLRLDAMVAVLSGEVPLLVTAHRAQDILTAIRLRDEFGFRLILDGAAEAPLVMDRIVAAGVPVIAHAPMVRHQGDLENATFELGARLADAGVPFTYQSGYESYVPKTRVVLFEAAIGAAHGLGFDRALRAITLDAAVILAIDDRVGSIEPGKDGDLALYDGDPFEYTSHCVATIIEGEVVSEGEF